MGIPVNTFLLYLRQRQQRLKPKPQQQQPPPQPQQQQQWPQPLRQVCASCWFMQFHLNTRHTTSEHSRSK